MNDVIDTAAGGPESYVPWDEDLARLEEPGAAIRVDWSFDKYLAASAFTSRSAIEDLRVRGPAFYHAKHIAKSLPDKDTPAKQLGRHFHMRLLEPERWAEQVLIWDPLPRPRGANGNAKRGTHARHLYAVWKSNAEQWEAKREDAARSGMIVIDSATASRIEAMAASVMAHKFGAKMFKPGGANEATILWHHPDTGIRIRARLDRMFDLDADTIVVVDAKSTDNPLPGAFAKSIVRYGYHRQGAIYVDAARALHPHKHVHYVIAATRSEPPYETAFYELGEESETGRGPLALGREQYTRTLYDLARRLCDDDWVAEWQGWCDQIELPEWAFKEQ